MICQSTYIHIYKLNGQFRIIHDICNKKYFIGFTQNLDYYYEAY